LFLNLTFTWKKDKELGDKMRGAAKCETMSNRQDCPVVNLRVALKLQIDLNLTLQRKKDDVFDNEMPGAVNSKNVCNKEDV
jgi:hypothetical protein